MRIVAVYFSMCVSIFGIRNIVYYSYTVSGEKRLIEPALRQLAVRSAVRLNPKKKGK